jgi:hypothetical protein
MKKVFKEMFSDKSGSLSTKRIIGAATIVTAIVFTGINLGEPDLVKAMLYSGFVGIGITAFEKKL